LSGFLSVNWQQLALCPLSRSYFDKITHLRDFEGKEWFVFILGLGAFTPGVNPSPSNLNQVPPPNCIIGAVQ